MRTPAPWHDRVVMMTNGNPNSSNVWAWLNHPLIGAIVGVQSSGTLTRMYVTSRIIRIVAANRIREIVEPNE